MEEEPLTPQVLSSAISSICAVISNYWSLIEVHVEYSSPLSLHRWIPATHLLHKVTLLETRRVISIFLFNLTRSSPLTPTASPQFEKTAGTLWCLTGLALGHIHCCIWQRIYSCFSQDTEIIFYMAPCSKYLSCTSFSASWHLKSDRSREPNYCWAVGFAGDFSISAKWKQCFYVNS